MGTAGESRNCRKFVEQRKVESLDLKQVIMKGKLSLRKQNMNAGRNVGESGEGM